MPWHTKTGAATLLAENPKTDVGPVLIHPLKKTIEAVSFDYDRPSWKIVDASVEGDFYYLQTFGDGTLVVTSRSLDEQRWLVALRTATGRPHYYRYDRDADIPGNPGKATFLFTGQDGLEKAKLSTVSPVIVKARDGLDPGQLPHAPLCGGFRARGPAREPSPDWCSGSTTGRRSASLARLQRRAAAAGQPRVRRSQRELSQDSTGFGTKVPQRRQPRVGRQDERRPRGRRAMGRRPEDCRPRKGRLVGAGYGGYAAAHRDWQRAPTPCVRRRAGRSLRTCRRSCDLGFRIPRSGERAARPASRRLANGRRQEAPRTAVSPSTHVDAIKSPLLIGQGKDDPRVREADTAAFVAALKAKHVPVTYAIFADEDHDLDEPANRTSFDALTEIFLAQCLGGPYQPIGDDITGSTMTVPIGAHHIYSLRTAMGVK